MVLYLALIANIGTPNNALFGLPIFVSLDNRNRVTVFMTLVVTMYI